MSKKVYNKEELEKAEKIKGDVRNFIAQAAINAKSSVFVDRKKEAKSSSRSEKHKSRQTI